MRDVFSAWPNRRGPILSFPTDEQRGRRPDTAEQRTAAPRASHLQDGDSVKIEADVTAVCLCGHTGPVDVTALLKRWNVHERLSRIEDKLKCTQCKAVGASSFTVAWKDER